METTMRPSRALIIGASRGLGLGLCEEFVRRGWHVTGTVRDARSGRLHALARRHPGALTVEHVDITDPGTMAALRQRLDGQRFDLLFVNAGILSDSEHSAAEITTEAFTRLMLTNALGPLRTLEALRGLIERSGTLAVMSSGLGSVAENERGVWDCYSASKAALNMLMRGFAARHRDRAVVIVAPGWVRTDMGGPAAPLGVEDSIPGVVDTVTARAGRPGLSYLDYTGRTVAW
jgi:NAD(P)-dependent dehydrogenase (short-subunit alcohol dehydrogenase family)